MNSDGVIRLLNNMTIRFTQPTELNDPYECHLTIDKKTIQLIKEDYQEFRKREQPEKSDQYCKERAEENESTLIENALIRYRDYRDSFGVLSLTESPLNLLMWAHYGDEHKGAVIELDPSHQCLTTATKSGKEFAGLFAVKYTPNKVSGIPDPNVVIETLLTKSTEWGYEKEWRYIRTLNLLQDVGNGIHVTEIKPKAIKRIILGARFPAERLPEITAFTSKPEFSHVIVQKAMIIPNKFGLKLIDADKYGWVLLHREHHFGDASDEALLCVIMDEDEQEP